MPALYVKGVFHKLTLYVDIYKNEIIGLVLSIRRRNLVAYFERLKIVLEKMEKDVLAIILGFIKTKIE
jgi:hypothetical protein